MEDSDHLRTPSVIQQDVDSSSEIREHSVELPLATTMNNSGHNDLHSFTSCNNDSSDMFARFSGHGSSYDESSAGSSVLTSSLSSFEFAGKEDVATPRELPVGSLQLDGEESSNEDIVAEMIDDLMTRQGAEVSRALAERISCIDSIKWLGHHLPESVVAFLVDEIEGEEAGRGPLSDSEMYGVASSLDVCDFEESQLQHHDEDRSIPDIDLSLHNFQNHPLPYPVHEDHDHSGLYEEDMQGNRNDSVVLRKNEDGKERTKTRRQRSRRMADGTRKAHLDHSGLANRNQQNAHALRAEHDVSFTWDESAGYHADFHESRNGMVSECSAPSNRIARNDDSCLDRFHDENDLGDDVNRAANDPVHNSNRRYRPQRRHSVMGLKATMESSDPGELGRVSVEERKPRSRAGRRSSMPLVMRSMDARDRQSGQESVMHSFSEHACDSSSGGSGSSLQFHKQTNHRKFARRMKRRGSAVSGKSVSSLLLEPLVALDGFVGPNSAYSGAGSVKDTFPYASDDEKREFIRNSRVMKTRDCIIKLSDDMKLGDAQNQVEELGSDEEGEFENMYFMDAIPPATRHDCALLFIDISGFTKLSTTLEVEPLSKVRILLVSCELLSC